MSITFSNVDFVIHAYFKYVPRTRLLLLVLFVAENVVFKVDLLRAVACV